MATDSNELLKPGTICTTIHVNNKDEGRLVVILKYVGAAPHSDVDEGYWVGTLDKKPFVSIKAYQGESERFEVKANHTNAVIIDRSMLRPLIIEDGKAHDTPD